MRDLCAAHAAATGIGIAPRIFNTGPLGAGIIAEAVNIQPALLYIAQSGAPNIAIGASIVSCAPPPPQILEECSTAQTFI